MKKVFTESKERVGNSRYPGTDLKSAIQKTDDLRKRLGSGPYSRLEAAKALDYRGVSGASSTMVAALVHFGLLSRVHNTYKQSSLANRILIPTSDYDKKMAIAEAVKTPKLYRLLISNFKGTALPTLLPNVLFHSYNINEKVSKKVAKDFTDSIKFADLLQNGIVVDSEQEVVELEGLAATKNFVKPENDSKALISRSIGGITADNVAIPLTSNIVVSFPSELLRSVAEGKFADILKKLEELGEKLKGEVPESVTDQT